MSLSAPTNLADLLPFLQHHLLSNVIPFWTQHALDPQGGLCTCIADDGTIINHDKLLWSQLRAIYTFSALYNRIQPRQQWLDIASQIFQFCAKFGRNDLGQWIFRVDRAGRPLDGATTIYVDGFALQGITEYALATHDPAALRLLNETYHNVRQRLDLPGSYPTWPYPIPPGLKAHGISMIFSSAFHELAKLTADPQIAAAALAHANQVMDHFRKPQKQALLEYVRQDGSEIDTPIGRVIVPGHAIESMWFQIHQFQDLAQPHRISQCIQCLQWHLNRGWDQQFGGLFLAVDLNSNPNVPWNFHDTKLSWPVTEALYALLLAHHHCREQWCLDWYWKIHHLAFRHYPVPLHGEWTQKLDRRFHPFTQPVALPVKDPFHLPRSLILSIQLLRQIS